MLPCEQSYCIDRDGVAPTHCVDVDAGEFCLAYADSLDDSCEAVPGTVEVDGSCWPAAWH